MSRKKTIPPTIRNEGNAVAVLPEPQDFSPLIAICRSCGSRKMKPLEKPRLVETGKLRVAFQNHRCQDCRTTTVARTQL